MSKVMCPGQDTRYWRPGDIFEVECANCKTMIEFFKDDASRKCKKCGTKVQNPKLNLGCAQWCEHAKECLGYDPKTTDGETDKLDASVSVKLLKHLKKQFGEQSNIYNNAISRYSKITKILANSEANPGLAIVSGMLLDVDDAKDIENGKLPISIKIMKEIEMEQIFIDNVCETIVKYNNNETNDEIQLIKNIL
jgi:hypothetical protein